jgi:glycosyltransferase involved in cell wall biosynthesis
MKLLIVIPALNEEESIASIIQRSIDAKAHIIRESPVTMVDITVVSDGSTDQTVAIASEYLSEIDLITFPQNRGYGAAIKTAWEQSDADLLGFLDADGTCDPLFFADLCNLIIEEDADIALGSRLSKESEMPLVRRIGNTFFAFLLSFLSYKKIKDTASGMRVVQRRSLADIMPLPDGLHFTPAMSARAVLHEDLRIVETNMPYKEREGESKLRIWKDGKRFLGVILESSVLYRPNRILFFCALIVFGIAIALLSTPVAHYLRNSTLEEWMIYRILLGNLLAVIFLLFLAGAYLTERITRITLLKNIEGQTISDVSFIYRFFSSRYPIYLAFVVFFLGIWIVKDSLLERISTGATTEHWSRYLMMSTLVATSFILVFAKLIDYILDQVADRVKYLRSDLFVRYKQKHGETI